MVTRTSLKEKRSLLFKVEKRDGSAFHRHKGGDIYLSVNAFGNGLKVPDGK
jgi:hypothetical protein